MGTRFNKVGNKKIWKDAELDEVVDEEKWKDTEDDESNDEEIWKDTEDDEASDEEIRKDTEDDEASDEEIWKDTEDDEADDEEKWKDTEDDEADDEEIWEYTEDDGIDNEEVEDDDEMWEQNETDEIDDELVWEDTEDGDIKSSVISKIQKLIDGIESTERPYIKLNEAEHTMFMELLEQNPNMKLSENYIKSKYRSESQNEAYHNKSTPEEKANFDKVNGNDYVSIRIARNLYINENYDRYTGTSRLTIENDILYGNDEYDYETKMFELKGIITPEELIDGMEDEIEKLSKMSVEDLISMATHNNEKIALNEEEIKQALIRKIAGQQQTIAEQRSEIDRLRESEEK